MRLPCLNGEAAISLARLDDHSVARSLRIAHTSVMLDRDALILEQIRWDLIRLDMQAKAIGQPLLAFMLDQAACLAEKELEQKRAAVVRMERSAIRGQTSNSGHG